MRATDIFPHQYNNAGKLYGDMPPPIDEHAILRHVGGNDIELNLILMMK
jgi:hypothetical protein